MGTTKATAKKKISSDSPKKTESQNIFIEGVTPMVDEGRYPAKATVGRPCAVQADIFRDGHDLLNAVILWRKKTEKSYHTAPMRPLVNDRWQGEFPIEAHVPYVFTIEAWTDHYASWLADLKKRVDAGLQVQSEVWEGIHQIENAAGNINGNNRGLMLNAINQLKKVNFDPKKSFQIASQGQLVSIMAKIQDRTDLYRFPKELEVRPDRLKAEFGTWYELFVRSQAVQYGKSGTFKDTEKRLDDIAEMGFDVIYLPPIHPVGRTARKGPNNTLRAGPNDPGSPWAIGNENGGHTAIEPALGTIDDFDHFVKAANQKGIEIALDFAIQCSPDHPWVKEHPDWFFQRPDGSIKYAENPPKKYEDIYPINFNCKDRDQLYYALKDVVLYWIDHGVKIFRVDNPHTKPLRFWEWLIKEIQKDHPDVLFLAEAFTRPKIMKALAKVGFTQSYTYFTWRNHKQEITEYLTELTSSGMEHFYRPNFFVNTPDILHEVLQKGGRPAFKMRLALAATLSPTYGIYSGYELCDNEARQSGSEEYLNSEKYQIRYWDWDYPGNIKDYIARVNAIRRMNPALQTLANLKFFWTDNDNLIFYGKATPDKSNVILVVVNLDPFHTQQGTAWVWPEDLGIKDGQRYEVRDLITGELYNWGRGNFVRLDPFYEPAHILRIEKRF
jgi:starch synthase (maltosyl-transferring)